MSETIERLFEGQCIILLFSPEPSGINVFYLDKQQHIATRTALNSTGPIHTLLDPQSMISKD